MGIIATSKHGKCVECGETDTAVIKKGKQTFCLNCRNSQKAKVQVAKANERDKLRGLHGKQVQAGNEDMASRAAIIQDIDYTCSRLVRLRAADKYGNCTCYTCGVNKNFSLQQNGHFVRRGHMALRFDFRNCRVQCRNCNENLGGNMDEYRKRLELEEPGLPEQLELEAREVFKYSIDDLKGLLYDLRCKLKPLELALKNRV